MADLSGRNIALACTFLSQLTQNDLVEVLGPPESEALARLDGNPLEKGLPNRLVKAAGRDDWIDEDDEDLRIIDLGESFLQAAEPQTLAQPGSLQAPETIFTNSFDYRVDLWRAGCVVRALHLNFQRRILTSVSADFYNSIWSTSISVPWEFRCPGCTNDLFCGGIAYRMAAKMGAYATELSTRMGTLDKLTFIA